MSPAGDTFGLENRNCLSRRSGGSVPSGSKQGGLIPLLSPWIVEVHLLCVTSYHLPLGACLCARTFPLSKDTSQTGFEPTLVTSAQLVYLCEEPLSKEGDALRDQELGIPRVNFERNTTQPTTFIKMLFP